MGSVRAGRRAAQEPPPGPPTSEIPGFALPERVLTRTDDIVLSVGPAQVYSTGLLVTFRARFGPRLSTAYDELLADLHTQMEWADGAESKVPMTMGVRYADGSTRSTTARPKATKGSTILLDLVEAGGDPEMWRFTFWVWPPTPTTVTFFAEWPARGVPSGTAELTSTELAAARSAVHHLGWPDPDTP